MSENFRIKLESVKFNDLGRARRVSVDIDNTTVVDAAGSVSDIDGRAKDIGSKIENTTSDYDREKVQERLANLVGGVAIEVGAAAETELKENEARVEDVPHASRAAVEEGTNSGRGVVLVRGIPAVQQLIGTLEGDEKIGAQFVLLALETRTIEQEKRT